MDDALALSKKAEALIAEGDEALGMPLLLSALDLDPCCFAALENLGIVAVESPEWVDALHERLAAAVAGARADDQRRFARWLALTHAAFHGRMEIVKSSVADPLWIAGDDAQLKASVGALLVELGEREKGIALLKESETALSGFHLGRLALEAGDSTEATRQFEGIAKKGLGGLLREAGLILIALSVALPEGRAEAIGEAKRLAARAERSEDALGPHVSSEILMLKLGAALAEKRKADAHWAAEQLGMPAHEHDPGAMLRAAKLLGPLPSLKG